MNKAQILAEIRLKIAGQGSAVDAGSALPGILSSITDLIPDEPGGDGPIRVSDIYSIDGATLDKLKPGDMVYVDEESSDLYIVMNYTDEGEGQDKKIFLVNVKGRYVQTVTYRYNADPESGESGEIGWGEGSGQTITIPESPTIEFASISDVDRLLPAGKIVKIGDAGEYDEVYTVSKSGTTGMELTSVTANVIKTAKFSSNDASSVTYVETVTTTLTPDA